MLEIKKYGDPVLRMESQPVRKITPEIKTLARNMLETMYAASGVGLAAPQVGIPCRLIVVDVGDGPITMINPQIMSARGEVSDREGCLSIPGVTGVVTRAEQVTVSGIDLDGNKVVLDAGGLLARALQHEIDHLAGILFVDKARDIVQEESMRAGR
ncbi:MAG TPA: peptide deformylase [Firmicutes bacterium]|nr:peptide deformylase [Bacillota bacterium]